uniref:Maestro-like HEAT-repeats domain-containing protein n=1 Tax=Megaselia scalaris TaxID=36166 RepID=T1H3N0_MEGSC
IVPRCIDTNATVRQISVDILQKTLEISCIYDTLTIAGSDDDWVKQLEHIKEFIISDDPKEIDKMAGEIAKIIALRMSNFQYLQFCKTLLGGLQDHELTSSIGSAGGGEIFSIFSFVKLFLEDCKIMNLHLLLDLLGGGCIPELVNESFSAIKYIDVSRARAKSGVLKSIVALTKHHPKLVCNEMLSQSLPFEENVVKYWNTVCLNEELTAQIIDNFLAILMASCLYEPSNDNAGDRQKIASVQPFAIFCAMREIFPSKEIKIKKFPELFAMLLTSLATYTNLAPPMLSVKSTSPTSNKTTSTSKSKFGFIPNKDSIKMNPCQVVLDTFLAFLNNLEMEQLFNVLTVCPSLAKSADLR